MKSALSLTLVVCLVASALPVAAQEKTDTPKSFDLRRPASQVTADTLARAVTREAVRLAGSGALTTSVIDTVQQSGRSISELQEQLKPGDAVLVTDHQGRETVGILKRLSSTSLVVLVNGDEREILATNMGRIEKRGGVGPVTLISTGVFAWFGMAVAGVSCSESPHCARDVTTVGVSFGAIAFAIGAVRDRTHRRTLVYGIKPDSPHALRPGRPVDAFGELWTRVNAGDTIDVLDASGRRTTGTLEQISASSIALRIDGQRREIPESEVRQVARRVDRLWTGALIGAAFGAVAGAKGSEHYRFSGALSGAVPFMAFGALIGAGIPRHTIVYATTFSRAQLSPGAPRAVRAPESPAGRGAP